MSIPVNNLVISTKELEKQSVSLHISYATTKECNPFCLGKVPHSTATNSLSIFDKIFNNVEQSLIINKSKRVG